jgi:hypothetical protein
MANQSTWERYREVGTIETNEEVSSMIADVVETIHGLERIYGNTMSALIVRALLVDYQALIGCANSRRITGYPGI